MRIPKSFVTYFDEFKGGGIDVECEAPDRFKFTAKVSVGYPNSIKTPVSGGATACDAAFLDLKRQFGNGEFYPVARKMLASVCEWEGLYFWTGSQVGKANLDASRLIVPPAPTATTSLPR